MLPGAVQWKFLNGKPVHQTGEAHVGNQAAQHFITAFAVRDNVARHHLIIDLAERQAESLPFVIRNVCGWKRTR